MATLQGHPLHNRSTEMDAALHVACGDIFITALDRPGDRSPSDNDVLSEKSVDVFLGVMASHAEAMTVDLVTTCGRVFARTYERAIQVGPARMDALAVKALHLHLRSAPGGGWSLPI